MRKVPLAVLIWMWWTVQGQAGPAHLVRLQQETIDTAPAGRAFLRSGKGTDKLDPLLQARRNQLPAASPLLVQFSGPLQPKQAGAVHRLGVQVVGYIPDYAALVRMDPARLDELTALPFVQWVGEYQPAHRVARELGALARRAVTSVSTQGPSKARAFAAPDRASATSAPPARASDYPEPPAYEEPKLLTVVLFPEADRAAVATLVEQQGGTVVASAATRSGGQLRVRLAPTAALALAEQPAIRWIEPYREPKLMNNIAVQGPRMNVQTVWTNFALTGSNQIIAVCDTGLDSGDTNTIHPDFAGRIYKAFARGRPATSDWSDQNGHGTHVSGSVLGSGLAYSNGLFRGVAYDAKLVLQSVEDDQGYLSGLPEDLNDLFLEAYTNNARIHSDSWGSSVDGAYDTYARQCDEFMWTHPDMLLVFAAGNDGADSLPTGDPDGVVDEDSLGSPATAKNLLTVGAAENARTNGGYATRLWSVFGYSAHPLSNDYVSSSYDGVHQGMAAFSSRGPCDDGRTKPDIVAPGTDILSAKSRPAGNTLWGAVAESTNYAYCGGTSMATPLTAGAAGLVRQYLVERRGLTNPPAALIKAMMLNAARSLNPGQYGTANAREIPDQARPNNVEGWGHVNLGETCFPTGGRTNALHLGQVATGQTNTYTFISTHTNTLSLVLAWSDYPGELAAALALVNDLDLRVITPNGQVHLGNGIPGGDRINNVEGLDVFPLTPGTTTVQVVGYNVPQGTNQPYALVIRESPQTYTFALQQATHAPEWPTNLQPVSLQTLVQAGVGGIGGVTNFYRINTGTWVEAAAGAANGYGPGMVYAVELAGQAVGTRVEYYAVAYDGGGAPYVSATNTFYVSDVVAYVKTNGTPVPPYNSWETAATNINDAVNAVIPGGIVWVTNGVYDGGVVIQKKVTVRSVNGATNTIIDGHGTIRCVKMDGVVYSVLDGFTLTNGVTPNGEVLGDKAGGGVLLREYAVVQNCLITGNRGMFGGGAACYNSKFRYEAGTISNCVIRGNYADTYYGGGVRLAYGGFLTHSRVEGNEGFGAAGGVNLEGYGGYMENCLVVGNLATNFSAYEPVAYGTGGGIETYGGGYIVNCTIVSNQAMYRGGVNFVNMGRIVNTIVWSNRQASGYEVDDDSTHDWIGLRADYSCAPGLNLTPVPGYARGLGNLTNHPQFANFSAGDYRLTLTSPCRDRGTNEFWEALVDEDYYRNMTGKADFDQTARVKNHLVDMGAYEFDYNDTNRPSLITLLPVDGAGSVDPHTTLALTFDEFVMAGPGTISLYRASGVLEQQFPASQAAVQIAGPTVTLTPTNALAFTNSYYVLVDTNAFSDLSTNWFPGLTSTSAWSFTTRDQGSYTTQVLRVDFGTNGSPLEADGAWQAFEVDDFSEIKPSLRTYTVGSSTITVSLNGTGAGIVSGRDRGQPSADAGALTYASMYRDMAQISSGNFTVKVSGVQAHATVGVRAWMYDYSFAGGSIMALTEVTDGRTTLFGQVTNVTGNAGKPTNNLMSSVAGTLVADASGSLMVQISGTAGTRLNGLELLITEETVISTSTLTIASAHGMALPDVGTHDYLNGESVTCLITNSPITQFPTQLVCTGWSGTGSVPASGSGTSVTFTITNTSTLSWLWTTNILSVVVSNLAVDSSFQPAVGSRVMGLDVDPAGRIMIVGSFTNVGAIHRQQIARLLSSGAVDTNLTVGAAYGDHDWALSVLCHSNGLSYVGGTMGGQLGHLGRYLAGGAVDASITNYPGGAIDNVADNAVEVMLAQADGRILLGGVFVNVMGEEHPGLARLSAAANVESGFAPTLDNFDGGWNSVQALAEQADGKIVVGGDFFTINATSRLNLARLHADGTLDTTFTNTLTGTSARVNALLVQTNGGLLAGGYFSHLNGQPATNLVRFNAEGTRDGGFNIAPNNRVHALLTLPDGRTLVGGEFTSVNGVEHRGLAMLKSDGTLDASFTMGVSGNVAGVVYDLHLEGTQSILVAGEFDYLGNLPRQNLGRLLLGGSTNQPPSSNQLTVAEYWAGQNQDGHARNASAVTLADHLQVRWARALTGLNENTLASRTNYAGQRGNTIAVRDGRVLALVPDPSNELSAASGAKFASFGTFALRDGQELHRTITTHLGGGTRGPATLQDSDTAYGLVNFYWNSNDVVFTAYGSDAARAYAFDAFSGTLPPGSPFSAMALAPNASGYFAMTDDNPLLYAHGGLNTHQSLSKARAGVVGAGEQQIAAMKCYNSYVLGGWDVFGFTMTNTVDNGCAPEALGTLITAYRFTNQPYGVTTNWTGVYPSNTFAGFGLNHVRGAPRPFALGADGRIYYYGFRNTMSGQVPTAPDYAAGMRLFAISASNGVPLFEINTGWNPESDSPLANPAWSEQRYHFFLPQISVSSNRVLVFHPQVNQGHTTNVWTRGRLFCFDTATTSLAWSVTYALDAFQAKPRLDEVIYNPNNNIDYNCMWADNTEQAVQMTVAGAHAYVVDPGLVGGADTGALQLTVYRYALSDGSVTVTNLVPRDELSNTIAAAAARMVNLNDNTNRVALRELAAVDGALVALVDVDLLAQALVVIEGTGTVDPTYPPAAAIQSPFAGIPPAVQSFNDHRLRYAAFTNVVPVLNRSGRPQMQVYDTGTPVPFSAAGSTDPDGGALNFTWDFGDGSTGTGALASHVYASWGGAPSVTNRVVQLTVVDDEGVTDRVRRVIWVRDVGGSVLTTLTASTDGYVHTAGASSNSNFGTAQDLEIRCADQGGVTQEIAYLKFDLSAVAVTSVVDAVLRVYVMTPKDFILEAHATATNWTEASLRGTQAPALGDRLGDVQVSQYDEGGGYTRAFHQWVEFPVLAHVLDTNQGAERAFALVTTNLSTTALELSSRQSTNSPSRAPQLVLRRHETGHAAPVITSTPPAQINYTDSATQTLTVAATSVAGATNLTYSWRQVSGPRRATISTNHSYEARTVTVTLPPGGGRYDFRCIVDDGLLYRETAVTFQDTAAVYFALTATVNQASAGSVNPSGGSYASGSVVQVTATPADGYHFVNWSGDAVGSTNPLALPMTGPRSIQANFVTNPPASGLGLVWRIDFNGSSNDTLSVSNFTGWTIASASRTQAFANVDGGSINSSITVRLLGSGTFNTYQRTMNAGSATNLYRDAGQTTGSQIGLAISNLVAGATYQLRVWYFDDEFSLGATQTYVNATDGGSTMLGALTNTLTASAATGHASLPNALYDARYCLSAACTAGSAGDLLINFSASSGNTKLNALELTDGGGAAPAASNLLTVTSAFGQATPAGAQYFLQGTSMTCVVSNALLTQGSTQWVCVGWTGTGSVPASGTGTSLTFTLSADSTLNWQWQTNYLLQAYATGPGSVGPTGGWYRATSNAILTASADTYYQFVQWTGAVTSTDLPLILPMTAPRQVWATFAEILYTNQTPATWLAQHGLPGSDAGALSDTDLDGMAAWEEWIAGTDPTNAASRLKATQHALQGGGLVVAWVPASGRWYAVYHSTNLVSTNTWPLLMETGGGSITDTMHSTEQRGFYRLDVRMNP